MGIFNNKEIFVNEETKNIFKNISPSIFGTDMYKLQYLVG